MAHSNIYPTWGLLELMKGLVQWNNMCRITMTPGSHGMSPEEFR